MANAMVLSVFERRRRVRRDPCVPWAFLRWSSPAVHIPTPWDAYNLTAPQTSEANLFFHLVWITTSVRGTNAIEMHLNANDTRRSKHSSAISQRYGTHGLSSRSKYHVTLCTPSRHIDTPSICSLPARPSRLSGPLALHVKCLTSRGTPPVFILPASHAQRSRRSYARRCSSRAMEG